jgi:hypothetical protein
MGDLTGLKQVFNGEDGERSVEGGCGLEGGETAEAAGFQFPLEGRQGGMVKDDGESLGKSCDGGH